MTNEEQLLLAKLENGELDGMVGMSASTGDTAVYTAGSI